jgi:hypothetical protein
MKDRLYHFSLSPMDFGQLIDGLCMRRDSWAETVRLLRGESKDPFFMGEECEDEEEAQQIADHYSEIIDTLLTQAAPQRGRKRATFVDRPKPGETVDGWCLYADIAGEGACPAERMDSGFAVYATERAALEECAEDMIARYQEFLRGEREACEIDNGLFAVPVTLHADGTVTDESGEHSP